MAHQQKQERKTGGKNKHARRDTERLKTRKFRWQPPNVYHNVYHNKSSKILTFYYMVLLLLLYDYRFYQEETKECTSLTQEKRRLKVNLNYILIIFL
jgi:hypothetical protein